MIKNYSAYIANLITTNKLGKALKSLRKMLKNSPHLNEIIVHSARYNELKEKIRLGVIDAEDESISKSKLMLAVLELVDEFEGVYEDNDDTVKNEMEAFVYSRGIVKIKHKGTGDIVMRDKNMTYNYKS